MARPTIQPTNQERPFEQDDLFFSTTDRKGVITSGNDVFVRVSGYPRETLVGAAHNIIRHPDMPRAVFALLWSYLHQGRPFAGYVKNMAADGSYYWVMALAAPAGNGYLSIRFKPSSPILSVVKGLYAELLAIEQAAGDAPGAWREGMARATDALLAALAQQGFSSYDQFMQAALATELASHRASVDAMVSPKTADRRAHAGRTDSTLSRLRMDCTRLDLALGQVFSRVSGLLDLIGTLDSKAAFLRTLASNIHLVALNALIASCHLSQDGEGLSVVAQNLASTSHESTTTIDSMAPQLTELTTAVRDMALSITMAKLQVEMEARFLRELAECADDDAQHDAIVARATQDLSALSESLGASVDRLVAALVRTREVIPSVKFLQHQLAADLRRLAGVRLLGRVQAAGLEAEGHFRELLDRISAELEQGGEELMHVGDGIQALCNDLPMLEQSASAFQVDIRTLSKAIAAA